MPNVTSSPHVTHDVITRSRTQRQPQNNEISLRPRLFLLPVTQVDMNKNYFPSAADWSIERNVEELHSLIHPYQRYLSDIQHNVEENCFSGGWVQIHYSWWHYDAWLTQLCSTNAQLHSCQLERRSCTAALPPPHGRDGKGELWPPTYPPAPQLSPWHFLSIAHPVP